MTTGRINQVTTITSKKKRTEVSAVLCVKKDRPAVCGGECFGVCVRDKRMTL